MNRPTITTEMVAAVASEIANEIGIEAETIAKAYSRYFDGYQLARELERYHYVDGLCIDDVNRLDEISGLDAAGLHCLRYRPVRGHFATR